MSFLGLDPSAVRSLAAQMRNASSEIQQLTQSLTTQLQNAHWVGPDRERFVGEWNGQHVSQLHAVMNALTEAAQAAEQNASQQEQASNS
ncbi:WXG100 family type VII secretion target [Acidiferrimicrobium sp. IK]|uniref:WXG100 family type VII secretion target n=1 Tax=Acidiferrimicrobium sp. IK TaxID=2871700 RepID=UPI0021CB2FB5|nr:WXG100 family type VII secretion target [Acidiferrimicrobium sp. IK]MCU4185601.1 WXG100 family type VII secretion target [Acidiferrimicrobium sp. IK]